MKNSIWIYLLVFLVGLFSCKSNSKQDINGGFEQLSANEQSPHLWSIDKCGDYKVSVDSTIKHQGKYSMRMECAADAGNIFFAYITNQIPAIYEGKEVELRAYIKLDNMKGYTSFLLHADGANGMLAYYNDTSTRLKGTADWKEYSIKLKMPDGAQKIQFGLNAYGNGRIWVDDFRILFDGKEISKAKIKEQFVNKASLDREFENGSKIGNFNPTNIQVANLALLAKVWGFMKYYHPAVAGGRYNWDYELFRILPDVLKAESTKECDRALLKWIEKAGKIKENLKDSMPDNKSIKLLPDVNWIENSDILGKNLSAGLIKIKLAERTGKNIYVSLLPGVGNPIFSNEMDYNLGPYPDAGYRLLALFRYWNMIEYFYPNRHLIGTDWNEILVKFIPKVVNAKNAAEYKETILELCASIHDTHAYTFRRSDPDQQRFSVREAFKFVEGRLIVADFFSEEYEKISPLKKGDEILKINNIPVDTIIKQKSPHIAASNWPTFLRNLAYELMQTNEKGISVVYQHNGKIASAFLESFRISQTWKISGLYKLNNKYWTVLNKDIGYLNIGGPNPAKLMTIVDAMKKTKGLIIDCRMYPSDFLIYTLIPYLYSDSMQFVKFTEGSILIPGIFTYTMDWKLPGMKSESYKGKIVIIVNENTQSSGEYHAMAFRKAKGALVIGSTTAGADGNVSSISLPGGFNTFISGIGVLYPDGRETQRVGIVPDIEVKPTIKGIMENRDELLERAIGIINGRN